MMSNARAIFATVFALTLTLAACGAGGGSSSGIPSGGGGSGTSVPSPSSGSSPSTSATASSGYGNATPQTCPNGSPTSSGTLNCTALPLGDQKYKTTGPQVGYVYECHTPSGAGQSTTGPWLNTTAMTWDGSTDANGKIAVQGSNVFNGQFSESSDGTTRTLSGNAEPISPVTVGNFPIAMTDPAHQYDGNPNSIDPHSISFRVPANPSAASSPACTSGGPIGIAMDGAMIFNAFDAQGNDAVAREVQDTCHGHPDQSDTYHYHGWLQICVTDAGSTTQNSTLVGYAADGYGIYGPWYNGKILTSSDLDECHGTTSDVIWDGKLTSIYHYVSTYDFPYTVACYEGTPTTIDV